MANSQALSPLLLLPVALFGCLPLKDALLKRWDKKKWFPCLRMLTALIIWLASIALLLGESYNPFIYFRF